MTTILMCIRGMISILIYMFVTMCIGQKITDYNNEIFYIIVSKIGFLSVQQLYVFSFLF